MVRTGSSRFYSRLFAVGCWSVCIGALAVYLVGRVEGVLADPSVVAGTGTQAVGSSVAVATPTPGVASLVAVTVDAVFGAGVVSVAVGVVLVAVGLGVLRTAL